MMPHANCLFLPGAFAACPWTSGSRAHMTVFILRCKRVSDERSCSHGDSGRRQPENQHWVRRLQVAAWLSMIINDLGWFLMFMSNLSSNDNKQTIKTTLQRCGLACADDETKAPWYNQWSGSSFIFPKETSYFEYSGLVHKKTHVDCHKSQRVRVVYSFSLNNQYINL